MRSSSVALVSLLLVTSVIAPFAITASAVAAPSGMVGVPTEQVEEDLPSDYGGSLRASDLRGETLASNNASSLEVIVTTPERAESYLGPDSTVIGSGESALVLRDSVSESGREVALNATAIREMRGSTPERVYGTHESGEFWSSETRVEDGSLVFEVPHFSANSVTFESEVSISASPGVDGSTWSYDLSDSSDTGDATINLSGTETTETETVSGAALSSGSTLDLQIAGTDPATGAEVTFIGHEETSAASATGTGSGTATVGGNVDPTGEEVYATGDTSTESDSVSGSGVGLDHSTSVSVNGNLEPTGSQNGEASVSVTGHSSTVTNAEMDTGNTDNGDYANAIGYYDSTGNKQHSEHQFTADATGIVQQVTFAEKGSGSLSSTTYVDMYIVEEGTDGDFRDGTKIRDDVEVSQYVGTGSFPISTDTDYKVEEGKTYTIGLFTDSTDTSSTGVVNLVQSDAGSVRYHNVQDGDVQAATDMDVTTKSTVEGLQVSDSEGSSTQIGTLSDGESTTVPLDMALSSSSVSFSGSGGGTIDYNVAWTERTGTEDPSIDIDGDGTEEASWTGIYASGQTTTTQSVDGLSTGDNSVSTSTTSGPAPSWDLSYTERTAVEDPSIDIDGDGTAEASYTGKLPEGQSSTQSLPDLAVGSTGTVSTSVGSVDLDVTATERTLSEDVAVDVNSCSVTESGSISSGTTVTKTVPNTCHVDGVNQVNLSVAPTLSADAPAAEVGFDYSHGASETTSVDYTAGKWVESYNVSHTYADERSSTSTVIPFDDSAVMSVSSVEMRVNGGGWSEVPDSDLTFDGSTLEVSTGSVTSGDTVEVRATGQKVSVANGDIEVSEPTPPGDDLDTLFEVTSKSEEMHIRVNESGYSRHRYLANPSWSGDNPVLHYSGERQDILLPGASVGSTARARTLPVDVDPSNQIETFVEESDETPIIRAKKGRTVGSDRVEIDYRGGVDGQDYQLWSVTNERTVISGEMSSGSVIFATDGSAQTYEIKQYSGSDGAAVVVGGGGGDNSGGSGPLPVLALFVGVTGSVLGTWYLGKRLGVSSRLVRGSLIGVGALVGLIGVEAVTARSIVSDVLFNLGSVLGSFASTGVGTIVGGLGVLLLVYLLDSRFGVPRWLKLGSGLAVGVWVIDSVTGGAFSSGLSEVSPLLWLVGGIGAVVLLWRALQPTTIQITGDEQ
ncbi:hypothetical protein [Haloarcula sp. CGMCC 1.2071]|uniref:hypothetical protein n=1 Tax=Haloarcula sp. CGMCC 1.2071 TaxID=3111454 RepID=UPI00300E8B4A